MKGKLSLVILTTAIIMISCASMTIIILQYPQTAQASPCHGDNGKEYCAGYHAGAIQAHRDYKTGDDMDVDRHRCTDSAEYCNGYDRGYSDEADFLGQS